MNVRVPDSVVVAFADDLNDTRLQLADVIVLPRQPTTLSAVRLIVATLCRLPGCELVGAGVAAGGCLLCARDSSWLVVGSGDYPVPAVLRLALGYRLVITGTITDHRVRPAGRPDRRHEGFPGVRRGPWPR